MEQVERGQGLDLLAMAVHSRFEWEVVPQMWEFSQRIVVLSKIRLEPAAAV